MKPFVFGLSAAFFALGAMPARAAEIATFYFMFESSGAYANNGPPEPFTLEHAVSEIAKRGLTTVTLITSCDTAETNCKEISKERHNVVALALIGKIGLGKVKFQSQHHGTTALKVPTGPDVREPLNRTVRIVTSQ